MKKMLWIIMLMSLPNPLLRAGVVEDAQETSAVIAKADSAKESWWEFSKRHAKKVGQVVQNLTQATSEGLASMHQDQNEESVVHPEVEKNIHLVFHPKLEDKSGGSSNLFTQKLPVSTEPIDHSVFKETPKDSESKSWKNWLKDLMSEFNSDVDSYEGDWDYSTKGITSQDIANVGDDTQIAGCALTSESLAKIQNLHNLMNSWKFSPVKAALMPIFPVGKLQELVSDLATQQVIPANIGQRIEEITSKIALLPQGAKRALNVAAMIKVLPKEQAIAYAGEVLPSLVPLINVGQDVVKAQQVLQEHSENPVEALRQLHNQGIETLKAVRIDKILKVIDNAIETKENTLEKTAKINRIVTHSAILLFGLALGSLVLSVIEGVTQNAVVRKIMEITMIFDLVAIAGGIGYGGSKLGNVLNPQAKTLVSVSTEDINSSQVEPLV